MIWIFFPCATLVFFERTDFVTFMKIAKILFLFLFICKSHAYIRRIALSGWNLGKSLRSMSFEHLFFKELFINVLILKQRQKIFFRAPAWTSIVNSLCLVITSNSLPQAYQLERAAVQVIFFVFFFKFL